MIRILYPFRMWARYEKKEYFEFGGFDEKDCMAGLFEYMGIYGKIISYGYVEDEDYCCGELIDNPA